VSAPSAGAEAEAEAGFSINVHQQQTLDYALSAGVAGPVGAVHTSQDQHLLHADAVPLTLPKALMH
jgi:hypothetical protein